VVTWLSDSRACFARQAAYSVPLTDLQRTPSDYTLVLTFMQNWGMWILFLAGIMHCTLKSTDAKALSLLCLANTVSSLLNLAVGETKTNAMCAELGMPEHGVLSNRAVALALVVLNYRGWQSSGAASFSLAPLMDRLGTHRWTAGTFVLDFSPTLASRYVILLCVLFGGMMLGDLDALLAAYKFSSAGLVSQVLEGKTFPLSPRLYRKYKYVMRR